MNKRQARYCRALAKKRIAERQVAKAEEENRRARTEADIAARRLEGLMKQLPEEERKRQEHKAVLVTQMLAGPCSPALVREFVSLYGVDEARRIGIPDLVIYTSMPTKGRDA